ncbi:MAG TPA: hypothetical protein V6C57_04695 [Coleofasciculaceae cyanobacterium]
MKAPLLGAFKRLWLHIEDNAKSKHDLNFQLRSLEWLVGTAVAQFS